MASGTEQTAERAKFKRLFMFAEHLEQIQRSADGGFVVFGWSLDGILGWWHLL